MKLLYVTFQSCRNYHITFLFDIGIAPGLRESCGFSQMEFTDVLCIIHQIIYPDTGRNLREYRSNQNIQSLEIRRFRFFKSLLDNLSLTFCTGEVRIHQTKTSISHGLNTV